MIVKVDHGELAAPSPLPASITTSPIIPPGTAAAAADVSDVAVFGIIIAMPRTGEKLILVSKVLCALFKNLQSLPLLFLSPLRRDFPNKTRTEPLTSCIISPLYIKSKLTGARVQDLG